MAFKKGKPLTFQRLDLAAGETKYFRYLGIVENAIEGYSTRDTDFATLCEIDEDLNELGNYCCPHSAVIKAVQTVDEGTLVAITYLEKAEWTDAEGKEKTSHRYSVDVVEIDGNESDFEDDDDDDDDTKDEL